MGLEQRIYYANPLPLNYEKTTNTELLKQFCLADTFHGMLFLIEEHFLSLNLVVILYVGQNIHSG
ncbi:hypothetical protein MASR2M36_20700 [Providencia sp.]